VVRFGPFASKLSKFTCCTPHNFSFSIMMNGTPLFSAPTLGTQQVSMDLERAAGGSSICDAEVSMDLERAAGGSSICDVEPTMMSMNGDDDDDDDGNMKSFFDWMDNDNIFIIVDEPKPTTKLQATMECDGADGNDDASEYDILDPKGPEYQALKYYTMTGYEEMNGSLRKQEYDGTPVPENVAEDIAHAKSGLAKLPTFMSKGLLFRGTGSDVKNYYTLQPGEVFCDAGFFSTSVRKETADKFILDNKLDEDEDDEGVLFIVTNKKEGKAIGFLSGVKSEAEVLFPPSTKFMIDYCEGNQVWMTEIVEEPMVTSKTLAADLDEEEDKVFVAEIVEEPAEEEEPAVLKSLDEVDDSQHIILSVPESEPEPEPELEMDLPVMEQESFLIASPIYIEEEFQSAKTVKATVEYDGFGTLYVSGRRRSARHQEPIGSLYRNGRRQSARLMKQ
jgi:ADP-ribosyltransferase exoenzyme